MNFPDLDIYYTSLGENIKKARDEAKLTQQDLANAIGLSRVSIVNIEKGRQKPMPHHLEMMVRILHCSLEDIYPKLNESKDMSVFNSILKNISELSPNEELNAFLKKHLNK